MGNQFYTGAGVLPYTIYNGTTLLLFQQTFEGKKVGTLIDFGGARAPSDASALETAAREFVEEGGLLLLNALGVKSSPAEIKELSEVALQENSMTIAASLALLADMKTPKKPLFEDSITAVVSGQWHRYTVYLHFIEYNDLVEINEVFNSSSKKKREFLWVEATKLVSDTLPRPLFSRLHHMETLRQTVSKLIAAVAPMNAQ